MPHHPISRLAIGGLAALTLLLGTALIQQDSPARAAASSHPIVTFGNTNGTDWTGDFTLHNFTSTPANWDTTDLICPAAATQAVGFLAHVGSAIEPVSPQTFAMNLPGYVGSVVGPGFPIDPATHTPSGYQGLSPTNSGEWNQTGGGGAYVPDIMQQQLPSGPASFSLDIGFVCADDSGYVVAGSDGNTVAAWTTLTYDQSGAWSVPAPKADTTVDVSAGAPSGGSVTIAALVNSNGASATDATGTVEFFENSVSVGSGTVSSGAATLALTGLSTGPHSYSATYTPAADDTKYNGSSSTTDATVSITASKSDASISLSGAVNGADGATFTATVTTAGATATSATGVVEFWSNGTKAGEGTLASGVANYSATGLTAGQTYSFTAKYGGDAAFNAAAESAPATVVIPAAPTPLHAGDTVTAGTTYAVEVPAGTFTAGETISGVIHSDPIPLSETAVAGADGSATFIFTAPASVPAGQHQLLLTGGISASVFTLAFSVAAGPVTDPSAANDPVSFATDWVNAASTTPLGATGLIGTIVVLLGALGAGGWLLIRRRASRRRASA